MTAIDHREFLKDLFMAAIAAATPDAAVIHNLPPRPAGRCLVVGAGKASAAMAHALEAAWPEVVMEGVVATPYGHGARCQKIRIIEAGHPVPDANSVAAAEDMLSFLGDAGANDLVIALISGGGSACLALPITGMTLAQTQDITRQLLRSGAPIAAMNTVRKALCRIKGGRLAAAAGPAKVATLVISDVPGDDPADVASGPTIPCQPNDELVFGILDQYRIDMTADVRLAIAAALRYPIDTRPQDEVRIVGSPARSLDAIAAIAHAQGIEVVQLGDRIEGEAASVAKDHARLAMRLADSSQSPMIVLSGGETTVTMQANSDGRGGRNTEYQLAMALALEAHPRIWSFAGDSDGIDGASDAAGALVSPDTLARAQSAGLNAAQALADHQSYDIFAALGDLVITGPTRTNINDIRLQLII